MNLDNRIKELEKVLNPENDEFITLIFQHVDEPGLHQKRLSEDLGYKTEFDEFIAAARRNNQNVAVWFCDDRFREKQPKALEY